MYRDPDDVAREKKLEARKIATEIANTYPLDTNTYGKTKLAVIEKLQERKLKGGQKTEYFRRTDSATPFSADALDPFK